ncbi:prolactin-releasing peptide receptor-like [Liolophura sinensis]|uniref:prolactin-releasing peptide receptor-like n=1 Tax=Liolophura sinensis TaxID=3198878 RepID=UPI0031598508
MSGNTGIKDQEGTADGSESFFGSIKLDMENITEEEYLRQLEILSNFTKGMESIDILQDKTWRTFVIALSVVVLVFGFLGNFIVVFVIVRNKNLRTVTNIFIANLCLSDMIICSFNIPFQLHYQISGHWIFGEALCRVVFPTFAVPVYVSSISILMIAVDRYILIVFPFKRRMTCPMALGIVLLIGLLSLSLAIPPIVFTHVTVEDIPFLQIHKVFCVEHWPQPSTINRQVYGTLLFVIQFCIPLIVTSMIYSKIYTVLQNRPLKKNETRRNHKTNKILISIVTLFTVCWLPWHIYSLIAEFNYDIVKGKYFVFCDVLLKMFAVSSACVNPFMYGWLNDNFRKELDHMVCKMTKSAAKRHAQIRSTFGNTTLMEQSRTDYPVTYTNGTAHHGLEKLVSGMEV